MSAKRIVIIGAGPTGLGAGWRLKELGYKNFEIYEKSNILGGLASSVTDENGFVNDHGGHVMFSHYKYFDNMVEKLLGNNFSELLRESWIWMMDRFVPYPFQSNIRHLPNEVVWECVEGLYEAQKNPNLPEENFGEWIDKMFGSGLAKYFMRPYNFKVWAHPPEMMDKGWIAERVATVDLKGILKNVILQEDSISWGPNNMFKFPLHGGTGGLYEPFRKILEDHLRFNVEIAGIDLDNKIVSFTNGETTNYDVLINTMPLDIFMKLSRGAPDILVDETDKLLHSSSLIVGIGIERPCPSTKNWIYFPEENTPFYRLTYLSNYSPYITPDKDRYFSLLLETSVSEHKPEDKSTILDRCFRGLIENKFLDESDMDRVASSFVEELPYSYPIPSTQRDEALGKIQPWLLSKDVYSRGRFGAWRYEIGNQDHSVMMGVEAATKILDYDDGLCEVDEPTFNSK